ncbi:hypothetical protein ACIBCN_39700 [Nocardia sp. NPDC051052]|uniref:phthiocerol/phthiodiolone dimycocerosyl transferase family protein n=1 Tax=Nocardia sp. NPDC051052 TaxID=3364322 RepID=UPI0037B815A9
MSLNFVRPLAPSEARFVTPSFFVGYSARVRGKLNVENVNRAFEALQQKYPVLAAHLERKGGDFVIVGPTAPTAGVVVLHGDIEDPMAGAELNHGSALSALRLTLDGDSAAVTFIVHHSIADAYHALAVFDDFWRIYADLQKARRTDVVPHPYPEPFEKLMADRGVGEYAEPTSGTAETSESLAGEHPNGFTAPVVRCTLSEAETNALLDYGRRNETTIHGLVSAAILRTESDVQAKPLTSIPFAYSADLRGRVQPPIEATAGTNVLGYTLFLGTDESASVTELAREINATLRAGLEDGSVIHSGLHSAEMGSLDASAPDSAAVSAPMGFPVIATNWGSIPSFDVAEEIVFKDFVGYAHVVSDAPAPALASNTYLISTFRGRLSITIGVFDSASAEKQVSAIGSYLRELI